MPNDFILIPVVLGPHKVVDMWVRAANVEAFQPANANPMGVRSYIRLKNSTELIPTSDTCQEILAALRGELTVVPDNIVLFPAGNNGKPTRIPTISFEPLTKPPYVSPFDPTDPPDKGEPA